MKKVKYTVAFLGLALFITGCGGEKTLTCNYMDEDLGANQELIITFSSDEITNVVANAILDYGIEIPEEELGTICDEYKDYKGMECDASIKETEVTVKLTIDPSTADNDTLTDLGIKKTTYEDVKADLEKEEYTCE